MVASVVMARQKKGAKSPVKGRQGKVRAILQEEAASSVKGKQEKVKATLEDGRVQAAIQAAVDDQTQLPNPTRRPNLYGSRFDILKRKLVSKRRA